MQKLPLPGDPHIQAWTWGLPLGNPAQGARVAHPVGSYQDRIYNVFKRADIRLTACMGWGGRGRGSIPLILQLLMPLTRTNSFRKAGSGGLASPAVLMGMCRWMMMSNAVLMGHDGPLREEGKQEDRQLPAQAYVVINLRGPYCPWVNKRKRGQRACSIIPTATYQLIQQI